MKNKILVLPEVYDEVNTWWPLAVVKKMYDIDSSSFNYVIKKGIIWRNKQSSQLILALVD